MDPPDPLLACVRGPGICGASLADLFGRLLSRLLDLYGLREPNVHAYVDQSTRASVTVPSLAIYSVKHSASLTRSRCRWSVECQSGSLERPSTLQLFQRFQRAALTCSIWSAWWIRWRLSLCVCVRFRAHALPSCWVVAKIQATQKPLALSAMLLPMINKLLE